MLIYKKYFEILSKKEGDEEKMAKIAGESEDIGLFRYSLIVPALNETFIEKSRNEYFINIASKEHTLPNGTKKYFSINAIKNWYYQYRKYGFEALKPGTRSDRGYSKRVPISIIETIEEIRKTRPHITKREIYEELCSKGEIWKQDVAESTFYRFLRINNEAISKERKRM